MRIENLIMSLDELSNINTEKFLEEDLKGYLIQGTRLLYAGRYYDTAIKYNRIDIYNNDGGIVVASFVFPDDVFGFSDIQKEELKRRVIDYSEGRIDCCECGKTIEIINSPRHYGGYYCSECFKETKDERY